MCSEGGTSSPSGHCITASESLPFEKPSHHQPLATPPIEERLSGACSIIHELMCVMSRSCEVIHLPKLRPFSSTNRSLKGPCECSAGVHVLVEFNSGQPRKNMATPTPAHLPNCRWPMVAPASWSPEKGQSCRGIAVPMSL